MFERDGTTSKRIIIENPNSLAAAYMLYIFKVMQSPEQNKKSDEVIPTAIKAITTIIVFGVPLIAGTIVIAGYGVYRVCKKLKRQHS